jgi:hypothetical protein
MLPMQSSQNNLVLTSNEAAYKDIFSSGLSLRVLPINSPTLGIWQSATAIKAYHFAGTGAYEEVFGSFEMQHDYQEGTDITFHVHWEPDSAGNGTTDYVLWFLEYTWKKLGDTDTGAVPLYNTATLVATNAWTNQISIFAPLSGVGKTINSQLVFRLHRNSTDPSDTFTGAAVLTQVGLHYKTDTLGSRQQGAK